ncbi:hypothetical protein MKEN_00609300 [Mycena kentingensis (nom. inval.)]|nr:hypothetical protein MKEN_00609300 [Mycena kentingensis (nom. inval.)]
MAIVYVSRCLPPAATLCATDARPDGQPIQDRFLTPFVLNKYVGTLTDATTPLQVLRAVRDAVIGLRNACLRQRILHRHLGIHSIILTSVVVQNDMRPNAKGAAVDANTVDVEDADPADYVEPEQAEGLDADTDIVTREPCVEPGNPAVANVDGHTSTFAFNSVKLLLQRRGIDLGPHDSMDDLESVFYILCYVFIALDPQGEALCDSELPYYIQQWTEPRQVNKLRDLGEVKALFMREHPGVRKTGLRLPGDRFLLF